LSVAIVGERTTSSSPPWSLKTTRGASLTGCRAPFATLTSQTRPGFSVTTAARDPGRKAIAHGLSNVAIDAIANGVSDAGRFAAPALESSEFVRAEVPHAARTKSAANWTERSFMRALRG
jgi:hypothetical protein